MDYKNKPIIFNSEQDMPYLPVSSGSMLWNKTGSWRYLRPVHQNYLSPCQAGCPTANNIESWIRYIEIGDYPQALKILRTENPFPGICGRVCFHPCQESCNRGQYDGEVSINNLERFLSEQEQEKAVTPDNFFSDTGFKVGVVGGGPAGLACAYHARRLGHQVVLFETNAEAGGICRYGIPSYRLPRYVLQREITMLREMGIELKVNTRVGRDITWEELEQQFDAVFIATGVWKSRKMMIDNEDAQGVMPGLKFLYQVANGEVPPLGKNILVIGGGNTALDTARTALRLAAPQGGKVYVVYRRSREEMPAFAAELKEADREGIEFIMLTAPERVLVEDGKVIGLECAKMRLGEPDDSGRRRPVKVDGSEHVMEADNIFAAIGEQLDEQMIPDGLELHWGKAVVDDTGLTSRKKWFAGGDMIDQPHSVVDALGSGKRAAIVMDCMHRGLDFSQIKETIGIGSKGVLSMRNYVMTLQEETIEDGKEVLPYEKINRFYFESSQRGKMPKLTLKQRLGTGGDDSIAATSKEVNLGLSRDAALHDSLRCFHCGQCTMCDTCLIYCPEVSIRRQVSEYGYHIDLDYCKGCGLCVKECPRGCIIMEKELR